MPSQPDSYEFSIKTPVTPVRWADYDAVRVCFPPVFSRQKPILCNRTFFHITSP